MEKDILPKIADDSFIDVPVRVRYADTDKMGVVYYGNYPVFFEVGRSEYMREIGFPYKDFEDLGYYLAVVNLEVKYHGAAVYDDLITVKTRISEVKSRGLTFHYLIYRENTLLVEGTTKHLCITPEKKPTVMPRVFLDILEDARSK